MSSKFVYLHYFNITIYWISVIINSKLDRLYRHDLNKSELVEPKIIFFLNLPVYSVPNMMLNIMKMYNGERANDIRMKATDKMKDPVTPTVLHPR